eukprot:1012646-Pelagomonas_calceolata.AAC.4
MQLGGRWVRGAHHDGVWGALHDFIAQPLNVLDLAGVLEHTLCTGRRPARQEFSKEHKGLTLQKQFHSGGREQGRFWGTPSAPGDDLHAMSSVRGTRASHSKSLFHSGGREQGRFWNTPSAPGNDLHAPLFLQTTHFFDAINKRYDSTSK